MTTNIAVNGDFSSGALAPWVATGTPTPAIARVVNGALELDIAGYDVGGQYGAGIEQWPLTFPAIGNYWLVFRAWATTPSFMVYGVYTGHAGEDPEPQEAGATVTTSPQTYALLVASGTGLSNRNLNIRVDSPTPATFHLDDVYLVAENLVTNGEFDSGVPPWTVTGATSGTTSGGKLTIVVPAGTAQTAVRLSQAVALPGAGYYSVGWRASSSVPRTIRVDNSSGQRTANLDATMRSFAINDFTSNGPVPGNVLTFNLGGPEAATFVFESVNMFFTLLAAQIAIDVPSTVLSPVVIHITGLVPGGRVVLTRTVDGVETAIATLTANQSGSVTYSDYMYPFGASVTYSVYDGTQTLQMAVATPIQTPDASVPWLRDTFVPELLNAPTAIVDVTGRSRGGRVTVYRIVGQKFPVTLGDMRQASEGTLTVLCGSHADRDQVIATLSSGYPCSLRVPSACRDVIDDMVFTPLDIIENRFGTNGACTLDIDFVESVATDLAQYVATSYAIQTANASANNILYQDLASRFVGLNYGALYLSPDGINPS